MDIEIVNWDKYNPKRDQSTYTWLRLNNDIATDPDLFGLDAEQKFVWIEMLCQASRKNKGTISINIEQLAHVTGVKIQKINALLEFLQIKPIVRIHDRALPPVVATTTPTYERTNETNVRTNEVLSIAQKRSRPFVIDSKDLFRSSLGEYVKEWVGLYNEIYVEREVSKALLWLKANPNKSKKSIRGWVSFFGGWFERAWDKTTTRGPSNTSSAEVADLSDIKWSGPEGA